MPSRPRFSLYFTIGERRNRENLQLKQDVQDTSHNMYFHFCLTVNLQIIPITMSQDIECSPATTNHEERKFNLISKF